MTAALTMKRRPAAAPLRAFARRDRGDVLACGIGADTRISLLLQLVWPATRMSACLTTPILGWQAVILVFCDALQILVELGLALQAGRSSIPCSPSWPTGASATCRIARPTRRN